MSRPKHVKLIVIGLLPLAGCFSPEPPTRQQLERGLVVMLSGIESGAWQFEGPIRGLRAAGLDQAVIVIEWGQRPFKSLANLIDLPANRERARRIASRIEQYGKDFPDKPVTLLGYSGGGGIAVLVAESLPDDCKLDRIILIAAALSPQHDLTTAMGHCRNGMINFYSANDFVMLGAGTTLFGTIDRVYSDSAGHVGFCNAQGQLLDCPGLTQIAWKPDWFWLGHNGGHAGWLSASWSQRELGPWIDAKLGKATH